MHIQETDTSTKRIKIRSAQNVHLTVRFGYAGVASTQVILLTKPKRVLIGPKIDGLDRFTLSEIAGGNDKLIGNVLRINARSTRAIGRRTPGPHSVNVIVEFYHAGAREPFADFELTGQVDNADDMAVWQLDVSIIEKH